MWRERFSYTVLLFTPWKKKPRKQYFPEIMEKSFILVFSLFSPDNLCPWKHYSGISPSTKCSRPGWLKTVLNEQVKRRLKFQKTTGSKLSINWDTYEFWSRPYLIGTLTNESKNPKYWWFSFLFDISIQEGGKLRKKKNPLFFPQSLSSLPFSFMHTKYIYSTSFPMCSVTKRDVMKALCEWGCHGEAVPGKE